MNAGIRMGRRLMILTLLFLMKSSLALAVTPGTEKWSFPTGSRYTRSAAIGLDRTIYTTTVNGRLHAITPDGTKKWEFQTEEDTMTSPAIGADGTVYLGTGNGKLYAINPDGTLKWLFETDGIIRATHVNSPAIGSDGTIYIGSYRDFEGKLYAINPDGTLKWQFQAYAGTNAHEYSPVVGADGTIYASALHSLYAVNPDGTLKWEFLARLLIRGSPAIGADGTIYVLSQSGSPAQTSLYAINPDGTVKWEFQLRDSAHGSPVIGPDGTIYFGTFWEGKVHAINPDGTKKWELKPGGDQSTFMAPAVGADGAIYFGNLHGGFYAINPEGTLRWRSYTVSCTSSLTIGPDGTIYLGRDYRLLAIYSDSYGLAESPWPMWQYDIRHTGRIETGTAIIPLMPDEPYQGLIKPWPPDYFSLTVEEGRSLLIEVLPQAGVDALMLDGKLGALPPYPGMGEYTTREENSRGRYELLISPTEGGTYYFSLLGSKVDLAGGLYTITARFADQYLSDVMPRSAGNAGMIVLSVKGLGFTEGLDIQLSGEGPSFLAPEEMLFVSSAEVLARFDLSGAEPGIYHVTVTWAGGEQDSLSEAFEIMEGGSAQLEARLDPPDAVRPGRTYTVWLEYENTGNVDMLAPLFTVTGNCPISLDEERITLERVGILGIGGSAMPEVLRIGESRRVPIYFIAPSDVDRAEFTLFITEDSDEPIDWAAQKDLMKAPDMTQEEWDALWPELIRRLGDTWGEYLEVLRNNARRLKGRGIDGYDVRTLIRLEARQAAGLPVASVSGTLRDRGTGAALKGVPIKVTNEDGTILKQVETAFNPEGHFCVEDLPDGTYEIRPEGYYFEIPVTVTISGGQDVNGLVLFAREVPPPEVPGEEMGIPDHRPAMAGDGTGRLYLVWEHAKEIWWAIGEGGEWAQSGPIPDAEGSGPVVVYDEGLLDGGASEGLFCAWESATRPKTIVWSAGRPEGGGITWSTPQALTWDSYDDYGVAVITDTDHNPLILWLQRDAGIEDDADLYYQGLDLSGVSYYWVEPPEGVVTQIPIELCLSMGFAKGESLPKWIPIIGANMDLR